MRHLSCGICSRLHFVNLMLFRLLLVYVILRISPHHSHHLFLSPSITPSVFHCRLKTHLFHKILSCIVFLVHYALPSQILSLDRTKLALAFACFSFFIYLFVSGYVC